MTTITAAAHQLQPSETYRASLADGSVIFIPPDSLNRDFITLQAWINQGGVVTTET